MPTDCISYQNSGYFSPLMNDYLNQKSNLHNLYNKFPSIENFENQIVEKKNNFDQSLRKSLVTVLQKQYLTIKSSSLTQENIEALLIDNTFTVTTGHQLNLFTGPLYFLYKIISTINLTVELKEKYPQYNFVPVYWMATEDHDFEEINYFNFNGRKFRWNRDSGGPVGRMSTAGLEDLFEVFSVELGSSINALALKKLFKEAYLSHNNLADATRYLANVLFGSYGLVIIDADNSDLKRSFIPFIKEELSKQTSHKLVLETVKKLENYTIQVKPRDINLFYIEDNLRERILFEDDRYTVNNTAIEFSKTEILEFVEKFPEKFSPNVIMRPLYQEVILPNLCYIGGGGEIAYWLELKSFFDASNIIFPILLVRNSALLVVQKQEKKADKLNLCWSDLFSKQEDLINRKTKELSNFTLDLSPLKKQLLQQFETLYDLASQTDQDFMGALKAQEIKQIKGLENLEKRLLKAQKRKLAAVLQRMVELQNELFPNQSLQERQANFSEFYLESGENLIPTILNKLKPLENQFNIIVF